MTFKKNRNRLEESGNYGKSYSEPNVPEQMCIKCPKCGSMVFQKDVAENNQICPKCGHYFRLSARMRIKMTCDAGSFVEWDRGLVSADPLSFPGYAEKEALSRLQTGENSAVVTGKAAVDGIPFAIFAMEPRFMMGSMDSVVGEKITRLFEKAAEEKLPVIGFTVSGGARMQEGTYSLMQMAKTSGAVKRHSDAGLLFITVLTDPTTGGVTASFAMLGDILLAEPNALIAFAGPRVIEQTIRKKLPKGFQTAEFLLEKGFIDAVVERGNLKSTLSQILKFHSFKEEDKACEAVKKAVFPTVGNKDADVLEIMKVARDPKRLTGFSYIKNIIPDFIEFHGDRRFGDDTAIVGGVGTICGRPITVIAHEKGNSIEEKTHRNFGMAHPEGYRKALRLMKQAEKFGRPVLCFVDTAGAFCGIGAEERGQGQAIAENLMEMMTLRVPIISVLIGEGGSGGALALAVADEVWMLENTIYSVISPEGCSSILWKTPAKAKEAAECLKITAHDLFKAGIVERIIKEPTNERMLFRNLGSVLNAEFCRLAGENTEELLAKRYNRFRRIGEFKSI